MLKKVILAIAIFWSAEILYLCLIRINELTEVKIPYIDKLIHVFFYFVFSVLWFFAIRFNFKKWNSNQILRIVFLMSLVFGIAIELFQTYFTTYRSEDIKDVFANTTGTLLAVFNISILVKKNFYEIKLFV